AGPRHHEYGRPAARRPFPQRLPQGGRLSPRRSPLLTEKLDRGTLSAAARARSLLSSWVRFARTALASGDHGGCRHFLDGGVRGWTRRPFAHLEGSMRSLTLARSLALVALAAGLAAVPATAAPGKSPSLSPQLKDARDLGRAPA